MSSYDEIEGYANTLDLTPEEIRYLMDLVSDYGSNKYWDGASDESYASYCDRPHSDD
jgi:hypothetical protein